MLFLELAQDCTAAQDCTGLHTESVEAFRATLPLFLSFLLHVRDDSQPGTLTSQSHVLFVCRQGSSFYWLGDKRFSGHSVGNLLSDGSHNGYGDGRLCTHCVPSVRVDGPSQSNAQAPGCNVLSAGQHALLTAAEAVAGATDQQGVMLQCSHVAKVLAHVTVTAYHKP